jgi:hypothetical protein
MPAIKTIELEHLGGTTGSVREDDTPVSGRHSMRYPIHARVTFRWSTRNGLHRQGKGKSRDISEGGAFVMARNLPPIGASICLSIEFPRTDTSGRLLCMEMGGEVVRVELPLARKSNWGFAVASSRTTLHGRRDWDELPPIIQ